MSVDIGNAYNSLSLPYSFIEIGSGGDNKTVFTSDGEQSTIGGNLHVFGNISATGTVTPSVSSDDRLKFNEIVIDGATDVLMKLRPQIYDKILSIGGSIDDSYVESGLIAQEIWYDCPELRHLVTVGRKPGESKEDAEGNVEAYIDIPEDPQDDPDYTSWGPEPATVNYNGFIAYLIRGFQEQQQEIQALKEEIAILKQA